jgi:hypothetical protein
MLHLVALGAIFAATATIGLRGWLRSRVPAAEIERRRRAEVIASGKVTDGALLERRDHTLVFTYEVRGVAYTATQDVTGLDGFVPEDVEAFYGPVLVKYDAKNPANSIILGEEWSGFRFSTSHD